MSKTISKPNSKQDESSFEAKFKEFKLDFSKSGKMQQIRKHQYFEKPSVTKRLNSKKKSR